MKKRPIILISIIMMICLFAFACDCAGRKRIEILLTPHVTLTENVATWEENNFAECFEISINGVTSTVDKTVTSQTLLDGQMFKVRAIGDGKKFKTSEWSDAVTYSVAGSSSSGVSTSTSTSTSTNVSVSTSSGATQEAATEFSGFYLSLTRPGDAVMGMPMPPITPEMQLIEQYYNDEANVQGYTKPTSQICDAYVQSGDTVYFCVNFKGEQNNISSIKINDTVYSATDFSIYEEEIGGEVYQTLYLAKTLTLNSGIAEYSISEIKTTNDKTLSCEGGRTTAKVGVKYDLTQITFAYEPYFGSFNQLVNVSANIIDHQNIIGATAGWLRAVIIDTQTNTIVGHKAFAQGMNGLGVDGLDYGANYKVLIYLYADILDGNGVFVNIIREKDVFLHAIRYNSIGSSYGENGNDNCAELHVEIASLTPNVELGNLEVYDQDGAIVYENNAFTGEDTIPLLNDTFYKTRVYYYDPTCGNQYLENSFTTLALSQELNVSLQKVHNFINDAVFVFEMGEEEDAPNIKELNFKIWGDDENNAKTINLGTDLFRNQGYTYLVVKDYYSLAVDGVASCSLDAVIDLNDGSTPFNIDCVVYDDIYGMENTLTSGGAFNNGSVNFLINETAYGEYTITPEFFQQDLDFHSLNYLQYEVVLEKDGAKVDTLYTSTAPTWPIDEDAWLNDFVAVLKSDISLPSDHDKVVADMKEEYLSTLVWSWDFNLDEREDYLADGTTINIARLKERELFKNLSYVVPSDKDQDTVVSEMLDAILIYDDGYMQDIIAGCSTDREKLNALIDGVKNSHLLFSLSDCTNNLDLINYYNYDTAAYNEYFTLIEGAYLDGTMGLHTPLEESYINYVRKNLSHGDYYENGKISEQVVVIDTSSLGAGEYYVTVYYKLAGKEYLEGEYESSIQYEYPFIV